MSTFTVGQKVTVFQHSLAGQYIAGFTTVTKIGARIIVCADGSKWRPTGVGHYGATHSFRSPCIVQFLPEHEAVRTRQRRVTALRRFDWDTCTDEELAAAVAVANTTVRRRAAEKRSDVVSPELAEA